MDNLNVLLRHILFILRWKSCSQIGRKMGFAALKTVSNAKRFNSVSMDRLKELKVEKIKKRTYVKMRWAVKAYHDWRSNRMNDINAFDARIYESDINHVDLLEKDSFTFALCCFLAEVRKEDRNDYPGKTLYHLVVLIQKHVISKGKKWHLIESEQFGQV